MPLTIPKTSEVIAQVLANFESEIGQTTPLAPKAFLRVLAGVLGAQFTTLYKYGVERSLQTLALTATGTDLDLIGSNYGVDRKAGVAAILTVISASGNTPGTQVTPAIDWVGASNNVRYNSTTTATVSGAGVVTFDVQAQDVGVAGNLNFGDELIIGSPVAGLDSTVVVTIDSANATEGLDRETDEAYRRRVLNEIRTVGGGGNGVDYRTWAEEAEGVAAAYPYSGKPVDGSLGVTSYPGDRSVFIQADASLGTEGVADQTVLDAAESAILTDPDTGLSRPPLGFTESTLYVLSVTLTGMYLEVRNIDYGSGNPSTVTGLIETALDEYFATLVPFVDGVDPEISKNNVVTDLSISQVVQGVLASVGGFATGVAFGTSIGSYLDSYELGQGEILKVQAVTYV